MVDFRDASKDECAALAEIAMAIDVLFTVMAIKHRGIVGPALFTNSLLISAAQIVAETSIEVDPKAHFLSVCENAWQMGLLAMKEKQEFECNGKLDG